ncbi:MAG: polymer-forming cytoskeletal protein [Candidatus Kuenenbacteria bacterium]
MFKEKKNDTVEGVDTIIGPSVSVEGNFKGDGNIIVEGELKGSLKTKGFLRASESSVVVANISVGSAEVSGQVSGNIKVKDNLDIKETAIVDGDIETTTISVAYGAVLNGNIKMKSDKLPKKEGAVEEAIEEK